MLANPPVEALPPLDAISWTSSLGLGELATLWKKRKDWQSSPVGKVTGVVVLSHVDSLYVNVLLQSIEGVGGMLI